MIKFAIPLFFTLVWVAPAAADTSQNEIAYLLDFVATSGCTFERNGSSYESKEARMHIQRKYDHLKEKIATTEEFIQYAASESSMSGKQYHATCAGKKITSKEWLTTELQRYRQQPS